jgi:UDP-N-acetylglucosamine 2-epimerase (non-hydrolysing)
MRKVVLIFGTRPEAIKLAPVVDQLKKQRSNFETIVCVTAQHREMLDQVLGLFQIVPDYDLNIMKSGQNLFDVTTRALARIGNVLREEKPELVLVQGDTTTSFVGSLAAYYLKIAIGHVEAGLRTYNKYSPFPEEINRHMTGVLADYHFAPTEWAKNNLLRENVPQDRIWITGNTVIDALFMITKRHEDPHRRQYWSKMLSTKWSLPTDDGQKLILVTGHRREHFGKTFRNICAALKQIAVKRKDITIVYPVHLNPNIQEPVKDILKDQPNIRLLPPLEYEAFTFLMSCSDIILTDSGGIQEEAPSLGKPVLIMRETTERPEGIEAGTAKLIGTERAKIVYHVLELLENEALYETMSTATNPYGDGRAAERIVSELENLETLNR